MAQLALAVGGAAVGGAIGGGLGAQIGFVAGSFVGTLFASGGTVEGPRLNDLKVQTATYGKIIPRGYGIFREAGNVIWSTERKETKNTDKVGIKGAPGVTQVSYTYSVSLAIAFSDRQASNLLQLWANGKKILDNTGTPLAPGSQDVEKQLKVKFYPGSSTQTVDPTMEAEEGTGNVPTYKGICYIVLEDFQLADFGNVIPNFTAVIAFQSSDVYPKSDIEASTISPAVVFNQDTYCVDIWRPYFYAVKTDWLVKLDLNDNTISKVKSINNGSTYTGSAQSVPRIDEESDLWVQIQQSGGSNNSSPVWKVNSNTLEPIVSCGYRSGSLGGWERIPVFSIFYPSIIPGGNIINQEYERIMFCMSGVITKHISMFSREITYFNVNGEEKLVFLGNTNIGLKYGMLAIDKNLSLWAIGRGTTELGTASNAILREFRWVMGESDPDTEPGDGRKVIFLLNSEFDLGNLGAGLGYFHIIRSITYFLEDHSLIIGGDDGIVSSLNGRMIKFDIESETVTHSELYDFSSIYVQSQWVNGPQNGLLPWGDGNQNIQIFSASDLSIKYGPVDPRNWGNDGYASFVWDKKTNSAIYGIGVANTFRRIWLNRYQGGVESLQSVVSDICDTCNLDTTNDIDVSALSGNVRGFNIGRQVTGINALRSLGEAFLFFGVESDWKIVFKHYGQSLTFAIPENDLGVSSVIPSSEKSKLKEMFALEEELPFDFIIKYSDSDNDYNDGAQHESRSSDAVDTRTDVTLEFSVVFTATEAKSLAQEWLYKIWNEKTMVEFVVNHKYIRLDPGDVGTITIGSKVHIVRITNAKYGANRIIRFEGVVEDLSVYTTDIIGYGGEGRDATIYIPGASDCEIFDTTLILDQDATNGSGIRFYAGVKAYKNNWRGAVLFKSRDNLDFIDYAISQSKLEYGYLTTKLVPVKNWQSWQYVQTVTVEMTNGIPVSDTQLNVLNLKNAALVKDSNGIELIQYATVTDLGNNQYQLSDLLRARKGTDNFLTHPVGSLFVILSQDTIQRGLLDNNQFNTTAYFKSVTIGTIPDTTPSIFQNVIANSYKPWSVSDILGSRDGSNNLTGTFERRTRFNGGTADYIDQVVLNEESEVYEIDILDSQNTFDGSVLRTITATTEEFSYSAANQTTDGLTPGDKIDVAIYQLSEKVGRGFKATAYI